MYSGRLHADNTIVRSVADLDLQILVLLAPKRQSRQPIFPVDGLPGSAAVGRRDDPRASGEIGPGDLATNSAGRNHYPRIVADTLVFPRIVARHKDELALALGKPDRRTNRSPVFPEGCE